MKKSLYILIFLIIGNISAQSNITVGQEAPEINITNWIENIPVDKNLKNKYIVLEFWATWCGPCIAAVPHMNSIQKDFNQKDLYYISITDESVEKVERSLKRINFNSIVVTDLTKKTQINYGDGKEGLDAYPLTILIDKNGVIKWIGEPKDLNSNIMSKFLANTKAENKNYNLEQTVVQKEKKQIFDFNDLLKNREVKYYFDIQESKSAEKLKKTMGTNIISLKSYSLEDVYNDVFNIKNDQLQLPENINNKRFDVIYKNIEEAANLNMLEKDILKKLNLKKQMVLKPSKINMISIQDNSLLEETLEKRFSAKSDADDKIIFTAFTINNTLDELSNVSTVPFKFNDKNENKYDFIISIKSKEAMVESLKSYGLSVEEKDIKIEYITLIWGE